MIKNEENEMNIVIINGQNHKGSTYHIGRMLAERVGGNITEFFLRETSRTIVSDAVSALKLGQKAVCIMRRSSRL